MRYNFEPELLDNKVNINELPKKIYEYGKQLMSEDSVDKKIDEMRRLGIEFVNLENTRIKAYRNLMDDVWVRNNHTAWGGVNLVKLERKKLGNDIQFVNRVKERLEDIRKKDSRLAEAIGRFSVSEKEFKILSELLKIIDLPSHEAVSYLSGNVRYLTQLKEVGDARLAKDIRDMTIKAKGINAELGNRLIDLEKFAEEIRNLGFDASYFDSYIKVILLYLSILERKYPDSDFINELKDIESLRHLLHFYDVFSYFGDDIYELYLDQKGKVRGLIPIKISNRKDMIELRGRLLAEVRGNRCKRELRMGLLKMITQGEEEADWSHFNKFYDNLKGEEHEVVDLFGYRAGAKILMNGKKRYRQSPEDWKNIVIPEIQRNLNSKEHKERVIKDLREELLGFLNRFIEQIRKDISRSIEDLLKRVKKNLEKRIKKIEIGAARVEKLTKAREKELDRGLKAIRKRVDKKHDKLFKVFLKLRRLNGILFTRYNLNKMVVDLFRFYDASPEWLEYLEASLNKVNGDFAESADGIHKAIVGCEQVASMEEMGMVKEWRLLRAVHLLDKGPLLDKILSLLSEYVNQIRDILGLIEGKGFPVRIVEMDADRLFDYFKKVYAQKRGNRERLA